MTIPCDASSRLIEDLFEFFIHLDEVFFFKELCSRFSSFVVELFQNIRIYFEGIFKYGILEKMKKKKKKNVSIRELHRKNSFSIFAYCFESERIDREFPDGFRRDARRDRREIILPRFNY